MSNSILKLENIKKEYKDKKFTVGVLHDLNLTVEEGDFISIMGKSGSGKSTLLNIIGILDVPTEGNVYYRKEIINNFTEKNRDEIRNKMLGFIFQFHYLLPEFTALENVMLPALINKKKSKEEVEAEAKKLLIDVDMGHRLNHKSSELSGGEKQRVAIARSLINEPALILADEPTGNLDDETSEHIYQLLKKINIEKKQTIVVVTHSRELGDITNKKYILKKGKLQLGG
ncbi:ABC transporter ATP-binding protein [Haliovirga abyssi]|uniref:Lipoprotein-releasing system ATP-binding protein LolD n=1 Tax=Haliovirga abyssi TaxID=2996794 RepID=A0AAU9D3P3_9FUSO|nr:ABC transporter ATP-binding protein [Haliovirga abyssi]BDU50584.1 lipoprotein-releasing system ATP-binding protein LolD [Haliovirga abyssi]